MFADGNQNDNFYKLADMESPKVSIVTPVRNCEKFIAESIESVQRQTLKSWEHVIVDAVSTDATVDIVKKFMRSDSRIKLISEPDRGMYDAIFKGFNNSTGGICCWLNADDKLMPWALEMVNEYMISPKKDWVTGIPSYWDAKGRLYIVRFPQWYPRRLIKMGFFNQYLLGNIQQESTFFARRLIENLDKKFVEKIKTLQYAGDFFLWREFAKKTSLWSVPTVLSGFRIHSGNMSKAKTAYLNEMGKTFKVPSVLGIVMRCFFLPISCLGARFQAIPWYKNIHG